MSIWRRGVDGDFRIRRTGIDLASSGAFLHDSVLLNRICIIRHCRKRSFFFLSTEQWNEAELEEFWIQHEIKSNKVRARLFKC